MNRTIRILKYTAIVFLLLIISFFIFRKPVYNYFFTAAQKKIKEKYNCQIIIKDLSPEGLAGIKISQLVILPEKQDTLYTAEVFYGSIDLWPLLSGKMRLNSISIVNGRLNAINTRDKNNFSFLLKNRKAVQEGNSGKNYAAIVNKLISTVFGTVPSFIELKNNEVLYTDEIGSFKFIIPDLEYNHTMLKGEVLSVVGNNKDKWIVEGLINKKKEYFEGKIYGDSGAVVLPYLREKYNLQCRFDTLFFALKDKEADDDTLILKGEGYFYNLFIKHPKLDSGAIGIKHAGADYIFSFGKASVAFESHFMTLNKIAMSVKAGMSKYNNTAFFLNLKMKRIPAQDFFNSLPEGLFETFQGIKCEGDLAYDLNFALDVSKPDCVIFDSRLSEFNFKIRKFGITDYSKISGPFYYTAYEKGKPVKSFIVGTVNSEFTPLDQISPYLRNAVLQSEDGSFYYHNGFREDAFKMAIAANVKEGRFARGGSTISMQLVKNVFLNRKKTVARKLEEALIVWMIEKKRLASKDRMYEVYLNIIEWGPGIYGISEASKFYFNKKPSDLTIEESIFLASIVPRPKGFMWSFDEEGNLKPYLEYYFNKISELLLRREVITEEQRASVIANVKLTGSARNYVIKDTSIIIEEDIESDDIFGVEGEERLEKRFFLFKRNKGKSDENVLNKSEINKERLVNEQKENKKKEKNGFLKSNK